MLDQFINQDVLEYSFWGNTVRIYLIALVAFFVMIFVLKMFQNILIHRLEKLAQKTKTDIDDTFIVIIKSIRPQFYFLVAFYIAIRIITINHIAQKIIEAILIVSVVYMVIKAVQILIDYIAQKGIEKNEDSGAKSATNIISLVAKIILWSLGILLVLSNLGVDITSLVAGLGIGGIAIALAIQNILSDLFSSLAIYFDKPFVVGDFIIVGDKMGEVKKIGIKTTRIQALQGEEIVFSNKELTSAQIQNFKKMEQRRISFEFGVTYETSNQKLKKIPQLMQQIIDPIDNVIFDRAHFKNFGDFSLNFEVVYYLESAEYLDYMNTQQDINFKIRELFEQEKINMAYPTQTLHLSKE